MLFHILYNLELVEYEQEHNNTKVPSTYQNKSKLGPWIRKQRSTYKDKKMTEEHKQLLDSIGFEWDSSTKIKYKAAWEEMNERLVAYKKEYKDTKVPSRYKEDQKFGTWVNTQRIVYREKKMPEKRKCLLNSIGFFVPHSSQKNKATKNKASWEEMYERLVAYEKEHGDTTVRFHKSIASIPNLEFGYVLNALFTGKRKMTEERQQLLDSIGFVVPDLPTRIYI